jgi:predicted Zn-dependent peptidase
VGVVEFGAGCIISSLTTSGDIEFSGVPERGCISTLLARHTVTGGLEMHRSIIEAERKRKFPTKLSGITQDMFGDALCSDTWRGRMPSMLGTESSIQSTTIESICDHYRTEYTPPNMSLVCIGGISTPQLVQLLHDTAFVVTRTGSRAQYAVDVVVPKPRRSYDHVSAAQYEVGVVLAASTYFSAARIPMYYPPEALTIYVECLRELLMEELRQKRQWTYDVSVTAQRDASCRILYIITKVPHDRIDETREIISHCTQSVLSTIQVDTMRSRKLARLGMQDLCHSDVLDTASAYVQNYGRIIPLSESASNIESIRHCDLEDVALCMNDSMRYTQLYVP